MGISDVSGLVVAGVTAGALCSVGSGFSAILTFGYKEGIEQSQKVLQMCCATLINPPTAACVGALQFQPNTDVMDAICTMRVERILRLQSMASHVGTVSLISGIAGGALLAAAAGWGGYKWYTWRRAISLQNSSQALS